MNRNRGFTLIELLVVMAIIALLVGLLLPALAKARAQAKLMKDGTQIREVHQAWVVFAREFEGVFPTPGLKLRQPVNGQYIPGRGKELLPLNHTGNVHSLCIMANYYTPELAVGPTEISSNVAVMDDYNYDKYNPVASPAPIYWDDRFKANLDATSHTSYASIVLTGVRKQKQWRESMDSKFACIGNRGVENGSLDADIYLTSKTLQIHGGRKEWLGNVCFNDNHVQVENGFTPEGVNYQLSGDYNPDNLFRNDSGQSETSGDGFDIWLAISRQLIPGAGGLDDVTGYTPTLSWD